MNPFIDWLPIWLPFSSTFVTVDVWIPLMVTLSVFLENFAYTSRFFLSNVPGTHSSPSNVCHDLNWYPFFYPSELIVGSGEDHG